MIQFRAVVEVPGDLAGGLDGRWASQLDQIGCSGSWAKGNPWNVCSAETFLGLLLCSNFLWLVIYLPPSFNRLLCNPIQAAWDISTLKHTDLKGRDGGKCNLSNTFTMPDIVMLEPPEPSRGPALCPSSHRGPIQLRPSSRPGVSVGSLHTAPPTTRATHSHLETQLPSQF